MSLAELSIKRPVFISCVVALMLILGLLGLKKMPVDQFPDVTFPIVFVQVTYPGASPQDMEKQVSKIVEDELSSMSGLQTMTSYNYESLSMTVLKFNLGIDISEVEQQVRNRVGNVRNQFPKDAQEPIIRRFDPADQPIITLAVSSELNPGELFDITDEKIKPLFERISDVGQVEIIGGQKKEIQVLVDKNKIEERKLSLFGISQRIEQTSKDIPIGKVDNNIKEVVLRTKGEFQSLQELENVSVSFYGSDQAVMLKSVAKVKTGLETIKREAFLDGKTALFLDIFKQSGSNTVAVADRVKEKIQIVNEVLKEKNIKAQVSLVRDASIPIRLNVNDVKESILIGIGLCIIVVFFFLGSMRSTFITGMALPNSLLGGFFIMWLMGFSINIMTLLALSLAVGLLIDDAIVVRENIFRHMELGAKPMLAAVTGTKEVTLAVIATTCVVIAVFGPIAFVPGIIGQFFKQFGLTVVFTMLISTFDAFTMAPMLSAYLASPNEHHRGQGWLDRMLTAFDRIQNWIEDRYEATIKWTVIHKKTVIILSVFTFIASLAVIPFVPKTFLPPNEFGEFTVSVELPTGTSLQATKEFSKQIETKIKELGTTKMITLTVGSNQGAANIASFYVQLVDAKLRTLNTTETKEKLRNDLLIFSKEAIIAVSDIDISGGGQKPFNLFLKGDDLMVLSDYALKLQSRLQQIKGLVDVDTNFRKGKPEMQVVFDRKRSEALGVSTTVAGMELRYRTEGVEPAIYRDNGIEYKIKVKLEDQFKDLKTQFATTTVPNQNFNMIPLAKVSQLEETTGYSQINRLNKARFIAITANLGTNGNLGTATSEVENIIKYELPLPTGVEFNFEGQAQDFKDLVENMLIAMGLGVLFIYFVLASLYESLITPLTILLALPMAITGAMVSLFLTQKSIDIFSLIGIVMLLGVVAKNSILLVDYTLQLLAEGLSREEALVKACRTRLRPILMTSFALVAGTLPIALGITELGSQRMSMGIAIIGGVVSSTLLTLVIVPAAYGYIDDFRVWSGRIVKKIIEN